jgi:hypothetical protein
MSISLLVDDNDMFPDMQYDAVMSTLLPEDFVMSGEGYTEGVTVEDTIEHCLASPLAQSYTNRHGWRNIISLELKHEI